MWLSVPLQLPPAWARQKQHDVGSWQPAHQAARGSLHQLGCVGSPEEGELRLASI